MKTVAYAILSILAASMVVGTANATVCSNTNLDGCPIRFFVATYPTAPHPNTQIPITITLKCTCSGVANVQLLSGNQMLATKSFKVQSQLTYSESVSVLTPKEVGPWKLNIILTVADNTLDWTVNIHLVA